MIYYIDNIADIDIEPFYPYLSPDRYELQSRYRFQIDRIQSVLAYVLLRIAVFEEYQIPSILELGKEKYGKPYLKNYPHIHFNLSHCKKGVACAVDHNPIGIDIQDYVSHDAGIAKQFMTSEESELSKNDPTGAEFTRIWTLKESYGKYFGDGICYDMPSIHLHEGLQNDGSVIKSYLFRDFAISVTSKQPMKLVRFTLQDVLCKCKSLE